MYTKELKGPCLQNIQTVLKGIMVNLFITGEH